MKKIILSLLLVSSAAHANDEIKVQGDLMIHPDQISKFFDIATANA